MSNAIGLKQFRSDGCLAYLVFDPKTGEAALIDPSLDGMEDYQPYIAEHRLKLLYALDTHTHADHKSATHLIAQATNAKIGMSAVTRSARSTLKLKDGDRLPLGLLDFEVMATPGHTPDSLCFRVDKKLLLTGDTLLIGASGRTDFPGSDPGEQWESIHKKICALPDDTILLPGHDYSDLIFSTVGTEKKKNAHILLPSKAAFVEFKKAEVVGAIPAEMKATIEFNCSASPAPVSQGWGGKGMACGSALSGGDRMLSISVEKFHHKLEPHAPGMIAIDVRERDEFSERRIDGTINIPLSELALHLKELDPAKKIYTSCMAGTRSALAAKTLAYIGYPDVITVTGGIQAWMHAGLPTISG